MGSPDLSGPAGPRNTGLAVGVLAVGVGVITGRLADADAEVVQGLEDVGMAAQQSGDEHGQQQHDDGQDNRQSNHSGTSVRSAECGHRCRCLLPVLMLRSVACETVYLLAAFQPAGHPVTGTAIESAWPGARPG